jgi:hypothetical protein
MRLLDLNDNVVGEQSAREIAYRGLPLAFQGIASADLQQAVANVSGNSAMEVFGDKSTEIVDVAGRLLFRGFYSTLRDGRSLEVLVAADMSLGSPIASIGIHASLHRPAQSIGSALRAFGHTGVSLDASDRALVCYDYPRLAVKGKQAGADVVVDIYDHSVFSLERLEALGARSPLGKDRKAEWEKNISFLDGLWFGKETLEQCMKETNDTDCFELTLRAEVQENGDFCVPAVALMLLEQLGYGNFTQSQIATAMKTVVGNSPNRGTLVKNEVDGYSSLTGGKVTATSIVGPAFERAQAQLGTSAEPGLPFDARTATHAYAVCGWSAAAKMLCYYDPAGSGGPSWGSLQLSNFTFVFVAKS